MSIAQKNQSIRVAKVPSTIGSNVCKSAPTIGSKPMQKCIDLNGEYFEKQQSDFQ